MNDLRGGLCMSNLFARRKLVFKPTEHFVVNLKKMNREEKINKINSFSQHDNYQVKYKDGFLHLLDKISVEKGEWVEIRTN
jgi:predicted DNA-binding antitoxin AbrB/MazE fold protein